MIANAFCDRLAEDSVEVCWKGRARPPPVRSSVCRRQRSGWRRGRRAGRRSRTSHTAPVDLAPLDEGQVLVRNLFMSVDPVHARTHERREVVRAAISDWRSRSKAAPSAKSWSRADRPEARATSCSRCADGGTSSSRRPRSCAKSTPRYSRCPPHLGVLGMPGMTAWVGLKLAELQAGRSRLRLRRCWRRRQPRPDSSPSCAAASSSAARVGG